MENPATESFISNPLAISFFKNHIAKATQPGRDKWNEITGHKPVTNLQSLKAYVALKGAEKWCQLWLLSASLGTPPMISFS